MENRSRLNTGVITAENNDSKKFRIKIIKNLKNVVTFNYFYVIIKKIIFYFHTIAKIVKKCDIKTIQVVECLNKLSI